METLKTEEDIVEALKTDKDMIEALKTDEAINTEEDIVKALKTEEDIVKALKTDEEKVLMIESLQTEGEYDITKTKGDIETGFGGGRRGGPHQQRIPFAGSTVLRIVNN